MPCSKGAHVIDQLQEISNKNRIAVGEPAVKTDTYAVSADTHQAVATRRADATCSSYDIVRYAAQNSNGSMGFVDQF